jgi:arylsulfatase A-like enzyme
MMKSAGYSTGFFGKAQLGGGDEYFKSWGFDAYCVHGPFGEMADLTKILSFIIMPPFYP